MHLPTAMAIAFAAILLTNCAPEPAGAPSHNATDNGTSPQAAAEPSAGTDATIEKAAADPALAIEGEGLRLFDHASGSARPLPFGTPRAQILSALAFRGAPATGTNADCGVDYATWPDGLGLHFQGRKLVGWTVDQRSEGALTTASGIGTGSTREALDDAYAAQHSNSTLGAEFNAGGLAGLLDESGPEARIINLWAGIACIAR